MPPLNPTDHTPSRPAWALDVEALWTRVTGGELALDIVEMSEKTARSYEVQSRSGRVLVQATDAGAACVGLHQLLRRHFGVAVMWDTVLPLDLATGGDSEAIRGSAVVPDVYYMNFCTFGYSTAFWGWAEWEREIDWMALHGVTMPLAVVGHEATLRLAYGRLGLSEEAVRDFLGGPAHLPWVYMGNLDTFGGPLPTAWTDEHLDLGRRIINRQRALGMTPVLPAFTGHLPRELAPADAKSRLWQGMATTVVAPEDPLFTRATAEIVAAQRELFGTDHLYASDPFIEMIPADTDSSTDYPAAVADAIVRGLTAGDPDAVWVLQSWPFAYQRDYWTDERVREFLDAIPDERVIILDLWAEAQPQWDRLDGFYGKSWIWSALLNFGGRSEPVADLQAATTELGRALGSRHAPAGIGLTMEAIHNNAIFFERVADNAWSRVEDPEERVREFARQRYGIGPSADLESAWADLVATVFDADGERIFPEFFISVAVTKPSFAALLAPGSSIHDDVADALFYDPVVLVRGWKTLAYVAERRSELLGGPLGADLVQVGTAAMVRVIDQRFVRLLAGAASSNRVDPEEVAAFLQAFDDLDRLAATRPESRFETWEDSAARWGRDPESAALLRDNARRIVTVWNTSVDGHLDDYAAKIWSGLVRYYRSRWDAWCTLLPRALDPKGRAGADEDLARTLQALSETFLRDGPSSSAAESVIEVTRHLLHTYSNELAVAAGKDAGDA